jgi:hypothetical protein
MKLLRSCHHHLGAAILAVALLSGACSKPGGLVKWGYDHPKAGLRILYKDASKEQFIDDAWRVDNFYRGTSGGWSRKQGTDYYGIRLVEDERRGHVRQEHAHFFELKLNHAETNGVIWVQTFKLPTKHKATKLEVLLNNYVNSLSGSGLYLEGNIYGLQQIKVKKYSARVRHKRWIRLHHYNALRARIDIVNLDRFKVSSKDATTSVDVVLLRYWWTSTKEVQDPRNPVVWVKTRLHNPVMLVVGYKNAAAYFEKQRPDFQTFLQQIRFRNHPQPSIAPPTVVSPTVRQPAVRPPAVKPRVTVPRPHPPRKKKVQPLPD